jgi:predicted transcriptional regulator of viral defense system
MNYRTIRVVKEGALMYIKELESFFIQEKPFTLGEAAAALSMSHLEASKVLHRLKKQGHILHLRNGIYLPASHKGLSPEASFGDPWIIVPILFPDAYVGGWSAANYWGITEQIFRTTSLITKGKISHTAHKINRFEYALFKTRHKDDLGQEKIWREQIQIPVSDIHKTMVDMLENPRCGAGIQHTIDCFKTYMEEYYEEKTFMAYARGIKNGTFFKRLGYITEILLGPNHPLCFLAKDLITKNYAPIDSHMPCEKLVTKWNLYINEDLAL